MNSILADLNGWPVVKCHLYLCDNVARLLKLIEDSEIPDYGGLTFVFGRFKWFKKIAETISSSKRSSSPADLLVS